MDFVKVQGHVCAVAAFRGRLIAEQNQVPSFVKELPDLLGSSVGVVKYDLTTAFVVTIPETFQVDVSPPEEC